MIFDEHGVELQQISIFHFQSGDMIVRSAAPHSRGAVNPSEADFASAWVAALEADPFSFPEVDFRGGLDAIGAAGEIISVFQLGVETSDIKIAGVEIESGRVFGQPEVKRSPDDFYAGGGFEIRGLRLGLISSKKAAGTLYSRPSLRKESPGRMSM